MIALERRIDAKNVPSFFRTLDIMQEYCDHRNIATEQPRQQELIKKDFIDAILARRFDRSDDLVSRDQLDCLRRVNIIFPQQSVVPP